MSICPLKAVPCSHETGTARYPPETDTEEIPQFAEWRNNLTALSQYHNLFFIALEDEIHVFRPHFPTQTTHGEPALIIDLAVSEHAQPGYIDGSIPHAVNHLIVGDLGNEEILLAACDDGDVIAYRTRPIADALGLQHLHENDSIFEPMHFFLENVGDSAWGLAIHKSARLIAVSSNGHVIYVFVFALSGGDEAGQSTASNTPTSLQDSNHHCFNGDARRDQRFSPMWRQAENPLQERGCINFVITLSGHQTNIPNINFYNAGSTEDDARVFLASIDIDNYLVIWDVWRSAPLASSLAQFGICRARGWGVAVIDKSTAQSARTAFDSFGCVPEGPYSAALVDISANARGINDNCLLHPASSKFLGPASHAGSSVPETSTDSGTEGFEMEVTEDVDNDIDAYDLEQALSTFYQATEYGDLPDPDLNLPLEMNTLLGADSLLYGTEEMEPEIEGEDADHASEGSDQNSRSTPPNKINSNAAPLEENSLPFNVLATTETDVHFITDIRRRTYRCYLCRKAAHQRIPHSLQTLRHIERLNMVQQIPELGVVAIANQAGRVALLTLTYWQQQRRAGFKIDAILPYASQERQVMRPECPLMGMAIAPIQGHQAKIPCLEEGLEISSRELTGVRRFRLLMTYADHTILSYEISRPAGEMEILII